jgi:signal transduction histidine kinase
VSKPFLKLPKKFESYHFEIQHILVLFIVVVVFQTALSFINSQSTHQIFQQAMEYYRRDSAERVADLTTTALELLIEHGRTDNSTNGENRQSAIQSFDKLLSQQMLQRNIDEVYLLVNQGGRVVALRDGAEIYDLYLEQSSILMIENQPAAANAILYYHEHFQSLVDQEQIISSLEGNNTFHVLVPFYDKGEISGAAYMRVTPDVAGFLSLIESAYSQSGVLFTGLILVGFLAMFFIYSYTAQERDEVQHQLFDQRSKQLREQVEHQKESLFTKRIYHTHHKAEKVMGFIKEDLRGLKDKNLDETRNRVTKYANFVSRVIYDMKTYDPPLHVIRNPIFQTNINEVIQFIVENIFQRVYRVSESNAVSVELDFAEEIPILHINEYVVWEIIEPLIQNAIEHNVDHNLVIKIKTKFDEVNQRLTVEICDNGKGLSPELLKVDKYGQKAIFKESVSTKEGSQSSGYGCYLAWEISRRCDWVVDAHNKAEGGACFTLQAPTG